MMNLGAFPKQAYGFFLEDMDGESVIYRLGAHRAIHLNSTAAVIWKMCDGSRSIQELIQFLEPVYSDADVDIPSDVQHAVQLLINEGAVLLTEASERPQAS